MSCLCILEMKSILIVASIPNRLILIHSICWLSFSLFNCFPLWLKSVLVSVSFMYFVFISVAWVD